LSNVSNLFNKEALQTWCLDQASRMKYSREHRIKTQMSARDSVEACMRMLTIFSTLQSVRQLYCQFRQIATAPAIDAHEIGVDSEFWKDMHAKFHSVELYDAFPFEHIPTAYERKEADGTQFHFPPPDKIAGGILKAFDLLHGRKPTGYLDSFFSRPKLFQLWADSLASYRKTHLNWSRSGTAMSDPLYHYVLPVTVFDKHLPLKTCGIAVATKRWESIAWFVIIISHVCVLQLTYSLYPTGF
jgi:hypothetical protein